LFIPFLRGLSGLKSKFKSRNIGFMAFKKFNIFKWLNSSFGGEI